MVDPASAGAVAKAVAAAAHKLAGGAAESLGKAAAEASQAVAEVAETAIVSPIAREVTDPRRRPPVTEQHRVSSSMVEYGRGVVREETGYQRQNARADVSIRTPDGGKISVTAEAPTAEEVVTIVHRTIALGVQALAAHAALPTSGPARAPIAADVIRPDATTKEIES